jgi:hypothetical protein
MASNYNCLCAIGECQKGRPFRRVHQVKRQGPDARCVRPLILTRPVWVAALLHHLAADFAAGIGRGVDVDVVLAGRQVGGLGVRQRGAAFGGA